MPWLDALVFLSADDIQCELIGAARNRVLLKDRPADQHHPERKGILAVRGRQSARLMHLSEEHFARRSGERTPTPNLPLQGS